MALRDNYTQSLCLSLAERRSVADLGIFESLLAYLAEHGGLDRAVEFLPDARTFERRRRAASGLTRPELAILLAYTKSGLYHRLLDTDIPDEPQFHHYLRDYFPSQVQEACAECIDSHRLRREIIATQFANRVVDLLGIDFVHRTIRDTGANPVEVIRAALQALAILDVEATAERVFALDHAVAAEHQYEVLERLTGATEQTAAWILLTGADRSFPGEFVEAHRAALAELRSRLVEFLPPQNRRRFGDLAQAEESKGFPADLAHEIACLEYVPGGVWILEAARTAGAPLEAAARCFYAVGERLGLGWVRQQLLKSAAEDRWQKIAQSGVYMDLFRLQGQFTIGCLQGGTEGDGGVDAFLARLPGFMDRYFTALNEVHDRDQLGLASADVLARLLWLALEASRRM